MALLFHKEIVILIWALFDAYIGCSVAYYFLRKNSMADAKKLADYVEEYIIVPAEESEE